MNAWIRYEAAVSNTYGSTNALTVELGGLLLGEFDRLDIEGDAELDGNKPQCSADDCRLQFPAVLLPAVLALVNFHRVGLVAISIAI